MDIEHLDYNVRKAIETLTKLQKDGYVVETEESFIWKDRFLKLKCQIDTTLEDAESLYSDMTDNGLTVGMIEAEGYLRCTKQMATFVKQILEHNDTY